MCGLGAASYRTMYETWCCNADLDVQNAYTAAWAVQGPNTCRWGEVHQV
jgi:hypothetical protein